MTAGGKPWADGPFPLITPEHCGLEKSDSSAKLEGLDFTIMEMAGIHNVFLRGLNVIYLQAVNVGTSGSEQDQRDFVEFAQVWVNGLHEHHELEETYAFPEIERLSGAKDIMSVNVEQHAAFHGGLEAYQAYTKRVLEGGEKYDGLAFRGIIDSFAGVLGQHLSEEIVTLAGLRKFDKIDWKAFNAGLQAKVKEKINGDVASKWYPFVVSNHELESFGGFFRHWPDTPWFLRTVLDWFFVPWNKRMWRFSSCTVSGVRQDLPFA